MNFRKLILGSVVVCGAFGFAFASSSAFVTSAFVRVKFSGSTVFQCVNSGFQCSETGNNPCKVTITDLGRTTPGYRTSACGVVPMNSNPISGAFDPAAQIIDADF